MAKEEKTLVRPELTEFTAPTYDAWKAEAVATLKGADFDKKLLTKTYEGITLRPIYTKADFQGDEEFPGQGDYLRGTDAAGYMEHPWAIAQRVTACCPKKANEKILHAIRRGATAVNLDLRADVPVDSAEDMQTLLAGVDLSKTSLHLAAGCTALKALEEAATVPGFDKATGCVGGDPLGRLAKNGKLRRKLCVLYDEMAEAVRFAKKNAPGVRTVLVDANVYANGGASAVQETAFAMATVSEYMSALIERGVAPDDAAGSIRVALSLGSNFFMEIGKLRAARVVFAKIAETYGCSESARKLNVFVRTSSFTKTVFDPYVNILRATTESFAGVVGGVDALEVAPLDEPIGASDETTERIARNIQIMLQQEFDLLQPVDPAGGSWYVETLTRQLIQAISDKFKSIESAGGMFAALKSGAVQAEVQKTLNDRLFKLATRQDRAVGTNMYANMTEKRLVREPKAAHACCEGDPEITVEPISPHRWTEQFEALRIAAENAAEKNGKPITVFLANLGPIPQHKARADFSRGFFEVGGFRVLGNDGFQTPEEAAKAAAESKADAAIICSTDDTYPELVPPTAKAIRALAPDMKILLAGAPAPEMKDAYVEAGVSEFISIRSNCLEVLKKIQSERGIG